MKAARVRFFHPRNVHSEFAIGIAIALSLFLSPSRILLIFLLLLLPPFLLLLLLLLLLRRWSSVTPGNLALRLSTIKYVSSN